METRQLTILLHASLDPYNTTEEMELTWRDVILDWTNGKLDFSYYSLDVINFFFSSFAESSPEVYSTDLNPNLISLAFIVTGRC